MTTKITIKKATIKSGMFLQVEYTEDTDTGTNKVSKSCTAAVHQDMLDAFKGLDGHLQQLCEQHDRKGKAAECLTTGYSIGGSLDTEGVTLIGTRALSNGKKVNIVSPFTKWTDDEYKPVDELGAQIERCEEEVLAYLIDGKVRPDNQMSMFGEDDPDMA